MSISPMSRIVCRSFELVSSKFLDRKADHSAKVCLYIQRHSARWLRSIFFEALGSMAGHLLGYRFLRLDEYSHGCLSAATRMAASYGHRNMSLADGLVATWTTPIGAKDIEKIVAKIAQSAFGQYLPALCV